MRAVVLVCFVVVCSFAACSSVETSTPEHVGEVVDPGWAILPRDVDAGLCHALCCVPGDDSEGWKACGTAPIPGIACPLPGVCFELDAGP